MSHKVVLEQGDWIFEHFDFTLTTIFSIFSRLSLSKATLKPDGGSISSTTLTKMKVTSGLSRLVPLENAYHHGFNRKNRMKTCHSFKLPISWLSCNEGINVKLIRRNQCAKYIFINP